MNMKSVLHLLKLSAMAFISSFVAVNAEAQGTLYVSNLGNQWTEGGIGDIHPLFPGGAPYGNDTAHFTTGVGNFLLNTITLEFEFDITYPAGPSAPQWVSIQLFQGGSLLGTFGNPAINPEPTQWPKSSIPSRAYTQFIDFFSLQPITLNPFTQSPSSQACPPTARYLRGCCLPNHPLTLPRRIGRWMQQRPEIRLPAESFWSWVSKHQRFQSLIP